MFVRHRGGVLQDRVEQSVSRDLAVIVEGTLGVQPLLAGDPEVLCCGVLLVIAVDLEEEWRQRVCCLVSHLLEIRRGTGVARTGLVACWQAADRQPCTGSTRPGT